jgi:hypothetical protein
MTRLPDALSRHAKTLPVIIR